VTALRRVALLAVLFGLCSEIHVHAQSTNASLTGRITDSSKAVVADAKVIVINTSTRIRYESFANETGSYYVTNLPPGTYRIEVERLGFKAVIKSDVILHVQDTLEINFEMELGSASESVTVQGVLRYSIRIFDRRHSCGTAESQRTALERPQRF